MIKRYTVFGRDVNIEEYENGEIYKYEDVEKLLKEKDDKIKKLNNTIKELKDSGARAIFEIIRLKEQLGE